jgi:hypothetical protein
MGNQADLEKVLQSMDVGERIVVPGRGGWQMQIIRTNVGIECDFVHINFAPYGGDKFFVYSTVVNPYGAGKVFNETTLGVPCRNCGMAVDGRVVGATVLDATDKVTDRFSWSNIVYGKNPGSFAISTDGELTVNGQSKGYLHVVFLADKNRIDGYVGVFRPVKPSGAVKVLEMEDLVLASLTKA